MSSATLCVSVVGRRADQTRVSELISVGFWISCVTKGWGLLKLLSVYLGSTV